MKKYAFLCFFVILLSFVSFSCKTVEISKSDVHHSIKKITGIDISKVNNRISEELLQQSIELDPIQDFSSQDSFSSKELYEKNINEKYPSDFAFALVNDTELEQLRSENFDDYIKKIATKIDFVTKNDYEKVKIVHDLIILQNSPNFNSSEYAILFKYFCDSLKINCNIIHGYGIKSYNNLLAKWNEIDLNHFWNTVEINNTEYLVDCCWDSSFYDGVEHTKYYGTDWLFVEEYEIDKTKSHISLNTLFQENVNFIQSPMFNHESDFPYFNNIEQTQIIIPNLIIPPFYKIIYDENKVVFTLSMSKISLFINFEEKSIKNNL